MDMKIIYEDECLLVIDKPSGVTVNRSETTKEEETVQDWVEEYLEITNHKSQITNKLQNSNDKKKLEFGALDLEFTSRAGIVHRLDKETSGVLLIGKTLDCFLNLQKQFKERKVKKTYIALVHGKVTPSKGEIDVPVGRTPWNRKRFGIVAGGREATTMYKILNIKYYVSGEEKEALSLIELYPQTGRTHQIRVHLKYFGHPVFADNLYAGRKVARKDRKLLSRLFLHASEISFVHPVNNKTLQIKSSLPKDLSDFLLRLKY